MGVYRREFELLSRTVKELLKRLFEGIEFRDQGRTHFTKVEMPCQHHRNNTSDQRQESLTPRD